MKLPVILTSDWHLTANPRDEYRWGIFEWLAAKCRFHKVKTLCILGDLTDAKDFHSSTLVNRVVKNVLLLKKSVEEIIIMKGNHDYLKDGHAFFTFLSNYPGIWFCDSIFEDTTPDRAALFLPHTKNVHQDWEHFDFSLYDYVFMHQTVHGSIASNGMAMQGEIKPDEFKSLPHTQIYSGDIHVPQDIGNVRYVGSPYHVHFGDAFRPRLLLLRDDGKNGSDEMELYYPGISRVTIEADTPEKLHLQLAHLRPDDQVKIKINLEGWAHPFWDAIRKATLTRCKELGIICHGIDLVPPKSHRVLTSAAARIAKQSRPEDTLTQFVKYEDLGGDILDAGLDILS